LYQFSPPFVIVVAGGPHVNKERVCTPYAGVCTPVELAYLRAVVREALHSSYEKLDPKDSEMIAREVMAAYAGGMMDRQGLLQIARRTAKRCALDHFYDSATGVFA
jgi:Fe-S cluster assembly ATPase SufC